MRAPSANLKRTAKLLLALGLLSAVGACRLTIDESTVFRPQPRDDAAYNGQNGLEFLEHVFTAPSSITITSNVEGERSVVERAQEDFVPARVTNGFIAAGGERVAYTLVERDDPSRPFIVHCGGNASDRYNSGVDYALETTPFGDVMLFDYPGYGDSTGAPSAASFEAMAAPVIEFALARAENRPLVFWGHSLGGFVCARLAAQTPGADGLILEASARNAEEVAHAWTPWYARPFMHIDVAPTLASYDNAAAAAAFGKSVLILGAGKDGILPVELARALAEAVEEKGGAATYVELANANHINIGQQPGFKPAVSAYFASIEDQ